MQYDIDRFYALSERFEDNLAVMSCAAAIAKYAKAILKEFSFTRYKDELIKPLEVLINGLGDEDVKLFVRSIEAIIGKDKILSRDDFANIEAYSVFERSYDKTGKAKREKAKPKSKIARPRKVKKHVQLTFKF